MNENVEKLKEIRNRVKIEFNDLSVKCDMLDIFIIEHKNNIKIHKEYIKILEDQFNIMVEYRECLYQRIKYLTKIIDYEY